MPKRKRLVMAKVSTHPEHGARTFDLEFWQKAGSEARRAAAWEMVKHSVEVCGGDPEQLRCRKELTRIIIRTPRRAQPRRGQRR